MRVAVIAPNSVLHMLDGRPIHMALAHNVLEFPEYALFYREQTARGSYVIMDNSLMERGHVAMTMDDVLKAARMINAAEIVLPDVFQRSADTIHSTTTAFEYIDDPTEFQFAGVVHGETPEHLIKTYLWMAREPAINVIHVPKVIDTQWPGGRAAFLFYLHALNILCPKPHHLLGIWTSVFELTALTLLHQVRSVDTALPVQAAINGIVFSGLSGFTQKPKRPFDYFTLEDLDETTIQHNIDWIDQAARGNPQGRPK